MFTLPELPYSYASLEPHMGRETLELHHSQHHRAYVDKLNKLIAGTTMENLTLESVIFRTRDSRNAHDREIFNNAGQHWNHSFFWKSLSPQGGGKPTGDLAAAIDGAFGSFESFKREFKEQAVGHFGSGWAWLVFDKNQVDIMCTHDAELPLTTGETAILCCDLWEHAYYLDHRNSRPEYVDSFFENLANWRFASACHASAIVDEEARLPLG